MNAKESTIVSILENSAYLPNSGAYQNAYKGLLKLSRNELQSLFAVILCKLPKDNPKE